MNNESFFLLMDLCVMVFGIYGIAEWVKLKRAGQLIESKVILPSGCSLSDCKDPEGFYAFILPRFFLFSCLTVLGGALSVANDYWNLFGTGGILITMAVFLAILVVYSVMTRRAYNRFFR